MVLVKFHSFISRKSPLFFDTVTEWASKTSDDIIMSTSGVLLQVHKVNFFKSEKRILLLHT